MSRSLPSWQIDLIAAGVLIAVAAGAFTLQIRPALDAREERAQRATELAEVREKSSDLNTVAGQLKAKLSDARRAAAQSIRLEPLSQLNARLAKLTDLAASNALQLDAIEPGATSAANSGRYETVPIRLAGRGFYKDATAFLRTLHQSLPDTGVTVIELSATDNGSAATFVFQLQWHTLPRAEHDAGVKVASTGQN